MTKTNEILIESRFTFASPCITDTLSLPSVPSNTLRSMSSYSVLPHSFGFLLALQSLDMIYVDKLLSAAVQAMDHSRARAPFDFLYNYRRKMCIERFLLKQSNEWGSGKKKRLPFNFEILD